MKSKPAEPKKNSLRIFILFCCVVFLLILGSLSLKAYQVIKNSVYEPKHNFVVSIYRVDGVDIFGVSPKEKSLAVLHVNSGSEKINVQKDLGIASDASIVLPEWKGDIRLKNLLPSLIWFHEPYKSTLTWYDLIRLFLATGPIPPENTDEVSLTYTQSIDKEEYKNLFIDQKIVEENASVGIVNATGEPGVGKRMEEALDSRGYSVVSVTTARDIIPLSRIEYSRSELYTVMRLIRMTHFPSQQNAEPGVSDIIIVLGKDSLSKALY